MRELVHRHVPSDPSTRTAYAVGSALLGVPLVFEGGSRLLVGTPLRGLPIWGLGFLPEDLYVGNPVAFVFLLLGVAFCLASYHLARGVAEQAEAAPPEADPTRDAREAAADDDPVSELRARYARGELDDEEFDRRVERLLEVEDATAGDEGTPGTGTDAAASEDRKTRERLGEL
ncbi:SHOCT domain-containing protein [Halopelagius longus]|uniref:SHOCT domain-containing protein n=1 Tax=Halopelagius longus TaxID=1236180 RepID=A0A1H0YH09_9EURY|nr:SHOCT domain-containing protein [Halopelagius longus]RDI72480.1 SHOCT domain-containing protein [Halopelagius longus]SDQ14333.1 Short C-terminal domain-containing protein [Halopelagius longus]